jgi:glycosyltransferase involved in cell wall biosynthesis
MFLTEAIEGLVSIIIPTYNRYQPLLKAIESVNAQTYPHIEIIVINDCSTQPEYTNGHLETIQNVRVVHLPVNQRKVYNVLATQGKTREEGMKIARGEWIAFLDDDDYWYPDKLSTQLQHLKENPKIKMCSSNMECGHGTYVQGIPRNICFLNICHPSSKNILSKQVTMYVIRLY